MDTGRDTLIIGGGIGGLVLALSLHEVGHRVHIFESATEIRALGVGINLLPHAVRELDALGLLGRLSEQAVSPTTLSYFTKHGSLIWSEPRGLAAGYGWPQLSIHRGALQTTLLAAVEERIGAGRVHTGHHLVAISQNNRGVTATFDDRRAGTRLRFDSHAAIGADGIHSVVRQTIRPNEGPPMWNGALLWRGIVDHAPLIDGRTMVWAGHPGQKFISYPIGDLSGGLQRCNFIAELRGNETSLAEREDWNRPGELSDYLPAFESWTFPWLDVAAFIRSAPTTFVFPMVDRDPLDHWSKGRLTLLGDAAHPMYPIGSNGASQAILDARVLSACIRDYADPVEAFARYEAVRQPATSAIVLANRGLGPELPMKLVEERAPDGFAEIDDVISPDEIAAATQGYRQTAGFALAALADPTSLVDRQY